MIKNFKHKINLLVSAIIILGFIAIIFIKVEKLDTANNLMVRADKALYQAKNNGKNQVYILLS